MKAKSSKKALVGWGVLFLSLVLTISLVRSLYENWQKGDVVQERRLKLEKLEKENLRLKQELELAQTPEFVEREARNKLGLARPGEVVVILAQPEATPASQAATGLLAPSWKLWWRLFF